MSAHERLDDVVRTSYGRLLGRLSRVTGDLVACEDALSVAMERALRHWPTHGVPDRPEAWLLTVARNALRDGGRHAAVVAAAIDELRQDDVLAMEDPMRPDPRVALLFAVAHPALSVSVRAPLAMHVCFGLSAAEIAEVSLQSTDAVAKRLVRAKRKIRDAGIAIDIPGRHLFPDRLPPVLDAVYAAYGLSWDTLAPGVETEGRRREAEQLSEILVTALPTEPEVLGLAALVAFCEARVGARTDTHGRYVALSEQSPDQWDAGRIDRAETWLARAALARTPGRYQLEAAIQSTHLHARRTGRDLAPDRLLLYRALVRYRPTIGAWLGMAVTLAGVEGAAAGLDVLATLPTHRVDAHQPYHAVKAELLDRCGRSVEAAQARRRAIALCTDEAVVAWLTARGCA